MQDQMKCIWEHIENQQKSIKHNYVAVRSKLKILNYVKYQIKTELNNIG